MNDEPEVLAGPAVKVAQHLTAITRMATRLGDEAVNREHDREMPGGDAMASLGHVANLEAWAHRQDAAEEAFYAGRRVDFPETVHESDDDHQPVLQDLLFWSEALRREHDEELGERRATIASEANLIRHFIGWLWDNEPHWDDFARDMRMAQRKLENILREGHRDEPTRVHCDRESCTNKPRLIVVRMDDPDDDFWKCPGCKYHYDERAFRGATARQARSDGAEKFVTKVEAVSILRDHGRQRRTIDKWVEPLLRVDRCTVCKLKWTHGDYEQCPRSECGGQLEVIWKGDRESLVESYCELGTRRTMVWWPEMWTRHLASKRA